MEGNADLGEQPRASALTNRATPDGASFILRLFDDGMQNISSAPQVHCGSVHQIRGMRVDQFGRNPHEFAERAVECRKSRWLRRSGPISNGKRASTLCGNSILPGSSATIHGSGPNELVEQNGNLAV